MAIKETSVDAQVIYQHITKMNVGDSITYAELTALIGRNVQGAARPSLYAARRLAQREDRMVFGVDFGKGLTRLNDTGIVTAGCAGIRKIRRITRRCARVLACVNDFDAMPNESRIKHNAALSIFGALQQATKPASIKRVQEETQRMGDGLMPLAKTLALFA